MARASERLVGDKSLVRLVVELNRPIPMRAFSIRAVVERSGRTVSTTTIDIHDEDRSYARASGLHLNGHDIGPVATHPVAFPSVASSVEGSFPIGLTHDELAFDKSLDVRYGPAMSHGTGGETFMWARAKVPLIAGEEPSGFQRLCPLADCGTVSVGMKEPIGCLS
jgi:hypothetical protein